MNQALNNKHNGQALSKTCQLVATVLGSLAIVASAHAAGDKTAYEHSKAAAKTSYEAAVKQCDSMSGNAKDVCKLEAKAERVKMDAQAEVDYKGTPKAREEAAEDMAKADYNVAKEKCDDLSGNPKDVCVKQAKANYDKVRSDAKASRKVTEARKDAAEDRNEANYKVAAEKCDALAGDAKQACLNDAKAAYKQ